MSRLTEARWIVIAAVIGCSHPSEGRPMTTEINVMLDKLAELDGGGTRLAIRGELIAVASDEDVTLWRDLHREATAEAPDSIDRVRFRDDKELLAAPYALTVSGAAWGPLGELGPALLHGLSGPPKGDLKVRRADWSADGQELLVYVEQRPPRGVGSDSTEPQARLVWMDRARHVVAVPWTGRNFALNSVLLGVHWAVAAGQEIRVWDRHTHAAVTTINAHTLVVRDLAFSPDEHLLASVGNDHKVVLTDTTTWKTRATWDAHDGDAAGVAFHPTLPLIATTGQDGQVRVWTLSGKRIAAVATGVPGNAVVFSADGSRLIVAMDQKVVVFAVKVE